jgi:hypothetical protein
MKRWVAYYAALATICLLMGGCTLTKWTTDSVANFTSSTSPGSLFTADGLIQDQQKASLFVAVNFDNLRQDIAQGHGEYLMSLSALLHVPDGHRKDFFILMQHHYPVLYASGNVTPADTMTAMRTVWTQYEPRTDPPSASRMDGVSGAATTLAGLH